MFSISLSHFNIAQPTRRGFEQAQKCDVALVLGSGMHTGPFKDMPVLADKMIVVNLGPTAVDDTADIRLEMPCDHFMRELCKHLQITVPSFRFRQQCRVGWRTCDDDDRQISVFVRPAQENEAVTFAIACDVQCGQITREIDRSLSWTFEDTFTRADNVVVRLTPCEAYGVDDDVTVHFSTTDGDGQEKLVTFECVIGDEESNEQNDVVEADHPQHHQSLFKSLKRRLLKI